MAYLGKGLKSISTANITVDKMTGNGSATTMGISLGNQISGSVNDINVYISGVQQRPGTDYTLSGSTITFTTAPAVGWPVVAISKGDSLKDDVIDSSVTSESIKDGAVTDAKITSVAASKLTGALPALDGSALTNMVAYTKSANDPAIDTNPSGGLGTVWVNQSSGEVYSCTDATADANVWTNVGAGTGDVQFWGFPATIAGYMHGGSVGSYVASNTIEKFSIPNETNGTDVGDLTQSIRNAVGCSSNTHGYNAGGFGSPEAVRIEKYSFASDGNATDTTANLTANRNAHEGYSTNNHGYLAGNYPSSNIIDRFPFASSTHASDIGDLAVAMYSFASVSSETHGWAAGGSGSAIRMNNIQSFTFASSTNSTDVCNMDQVNRLQAGAGSATHGYSMGGDAAGGGNIYNVIEKWAFASSNNATNIADLTQNVNDNVGISSANNGYSLCGSTPSGASNVIDKFSFSSDSDATCLLYTSPSPRDRG